MGQNNNDIINDILSTFEGDSYKVIPDRREAIKYSIVNAKEGDVIMILGKGHEDYQIIGRTKIHLSDYEEVIKNINK